MTCSRFAKSSHILLSFETYRDLAEDPQPARATASTTAASPVRSNTRLKGRNLDTFARTCKAAGVVSPVALATVNVTNVAPTITSLTGSPATTFTGEAVTFTGTATDPSTPDTTAGFTWAVDSGSGFGLFGSNGFVTSFAACGSYTVAAKARNKDGGISAPFTSAAVQVYDGNFRPPLDPDSVNLVTRGQVVPVKITVGCNGFLSGLQPAIALRAGDYDPNVDPDDPSYDVGESGSNADTGGVMREVGGQYIYNLAIPSAPPGTLYTVVVRPFGGSAPVLRALLRIRR